jgi:hypothetical protein
MAVVQGDVLKPHNALVYLELGDPVYEKKRKTVRKDPLNRGMVERERKIHVAHFVF